MRTMPMPTAADAAACGARLDDLITDDVYGLAREIAEIECLWNRPDLRWADDSHPTGPWVLIAGPAEGCQRARIVITRDGDGLRAEVTARYAYTVGDLVSPDDDEDPLFVEEAKALHAAQYGDRSRPTGVWDITGSAPRLIAIAYDMDLFRPAAR